MCKYLVQLKQHTPMIHFQSEVGATLRASELKPKLDKFLMEYGNLDEKYLIDKNREALHYKVRINIDEQRVNFDKIPKEQTLYFGNMGDAVKKKFSNIDKSISVEFFSYEKEIISKIKEFLPAFFLYHNFGTRQSKGFGSFFIDETITLAKIQQYLKTGIGNKKVYCFDLGARKSTTVIQEIWKETRNDVNIKNFMHLNHQELNSEKFYLEKRLPNTKKIRVIKELLGWAYSFKAKTQKHEYLYFCDTAEDPYVDRFKSPITFKIIGKFLLMIVDEIPQNLYNLRIKICDKIKYEKNKNNEKSEKIKESLVVCLHTPQKDEFDLNDYLSYLIKFKKIKARQMILR